MPAANEKIARFNSGTKTTRPKATSLVIHGTEPHSEEVCGRCKTTKATLNVRACGGTNKHLTYHKPSLALSSGKSNVKEITHTHTHIPFRMHEMNNGAVMKNYNMNVILPHHKDDDGWMERYLRDTTLVKVAHKDKPLPSLPTFAIVTDNFPVLYHFVLNVILNGFCVWVCACVK